MTQREAPGSPGQPVSPINIPCLAIYMLIRHQLSGVMLIIWIPDRPRGCPVNNSDCARCMSDRVYHCTRFGRCLPVYDHFCPILHVTVYLRTIKAYLHTLIFLPLDAVITWALALTGMLGWTRGYYQYAVTLLLTTILLVHQVIVWAPDKFWLLACRNCIAPEKEVSNYLGLVVEFRPQLIVLTT